MGPPGRRAHRRGIDAYLKAREAIAKILGMNTLYQQEPDRTLKFGTQYWGDRAEAGQMLGEGGAASHAAP